MSRQLTNEQRVQQSILKRAIGERFCAQDIAKECCLTGTEAGNILKYQENVRHVSRTVARVKGQWERICPGAKA